MHNKSNLFVLGGLVGSTVVTGMVLAGPQVLADENHTATALVTVASVCSMTANVDLDSAHTATVVPGATTGDIGLTTITAFCNDSSGFAIYAIGYSNDEYGNTNMIGSIPGYDIATGTATSGPTSQWSMKISKVDNSIYKPGNLTITNSYNNYHAIPSDYEKVANYTTSTGTSGSQITTTYRAYIAPAQVADTYVGQVKYTMVHPNDAAKPELPCDGTKLAGTCITYMQDFGNLNAATFASVKNAMVAGQQYQFKDIRDNEIYNVAKLADGNIWMTQNLAIAGVTLNSETSDLASGTFALPASSTSWDQGDFDVPSVYVDTNGGYYNWDAATAGTGRGMSTAGTDAPGSICPKGWKLPRSGDYQGSGSLYALWSQYMPNINSHSWSGNPADPSVAPLSLAFSGYFDSWASEVYYVGDYVYWWSSTVTDSNYAFYGSVIRGGYVTPVYFGVRLDGYSVRCWAPGT